VGRGEKRIVQGGNNAKRKPTRETGSKDAKRIVTKVKRVLSNRDGLCQIRDSKKRRSRSYRACLRGQGQHSARPLEKGWERKRREVQRFQSSIEAKARKERNVEEGAGPMGPKERGKRVKPRTSGLSKKRSL